MSKVVRQISKDIGVNERTIFHSVKFYDMFPDLDSLPGGKDMSWNRLVKEHLTDPELGTHAEMTPVEAYERLIKSNEDIEKLADLWRHNVMNALDDMESNDRNKEDVHEYIMLASQQFIGGILISKRRK